MNLTKSWSKENQSFWQQFRERCFCISLRKCTDRRKILYKVFELSGLLGLVKMHLVTKPKEGGIYGCFRSHIECLKMSLNTDGKYFLIFEDDVLLPEPTGSVLNNVSSFLNDMQDEEFILYLGGHPLRQSFSVRPNIRSCSFITATHAYVISRKAAQKIAIQPYIGRHYDSILIENIKKTYIVDPMFALHNIFQTDNEYKGLNSIIPSLRAALGPTVCHRGLQFMSNNLYILIFACLIVIIIVIVVVWMIYSCK